MANPTIRVLRDGDPSKANPFSICIVANPALESPWQTGQFITDPITSDQAGFDACADYIVQALFGQLPNQRDQAFIDPSVAAKVRIVSVFVPGLPASSANSLIGQDSLSNLLVAQRTAFLPLLASLNLTADIAYAVSGSTTHTRASAWFTTDDDARPGIPFHLDGVPLTHRFFSLIPGTVAIHKTAQSVTALHEFQHAISSYSNGSIVDLYVDSNPALNCKRGRPIPPHFAQYNAANFATDPLRDGLGYPPTWQSYHCALINSALPAIMDDYWQSSTVPEECENDQITRQFIADRMNAKVGR